MGMRFTLDKFDLQARPKKGGSGPGEGADARWGPPQGAAGARGTPPRLAGGTPARSQDADRGLRAAAREGATLGAHSVRPAPPPRHPRTRSRSSA
jgi:hypothetical protein